jgi:pSer/pThr/pTyr-binding forkhead associated (FHA) protein
MADPRLNSIHLEPPRRQQYRRAREVLLNARGWQTVLAEQAPGISSAERPGTIIDNDKSHPPPSSLQCWLMDKDFIYPLKVGLNTVGRSPDNDVVIQDGYVSRRHCAILVHAGRIAELHDTASKNGTYLNGNKLSGPTRLNSGDEIRMCDRNLIFVTQDGEPGPAHTITALD